MMKAKYQFVLIDGNETRAVSRKFINILERTIVEKLHDLGLNAKREAKFISTASISSLDPKSPTVAVYFGSKQKKSSTTSLVESLCSKGTFILPVVDKLNNISAQLPKVLTEINALKREPADKKLNVIAARVLEELRLLRSKRSIFISYKRTESRAVALQLYQELDQRSFDVFLDTHSVERGVAFQPMLWDTLGDSDLAIFLDTPNALTSTYVEQELSRANALGLGVLQIVWPDHQRHPGTYFCEAIYLKNSDFIDGRASATSQLKKRKLSQIAFKAESLRARSMAARKSRVIGEFCRSVSTAGITALPHFMGPILVKHPSKGNFTVLPIVGHPDSKFIHEMFDTYRKEAKSPKKKPVLIYDPLGMWPQKSRHLFWLNEYLPLKTLPITEVSKWLK